MQRLECRVFKFEFLLFKFSCFFLKQPSYPWTTGLVAYDARRRHCQGTESAAPTWFIVYNNYKEGIRAVDYGSCIHVMRGISYSLQNCCKDCTIYYVFWEKWTLVALQPKQKIQESGTIVQYVNKVTPTESKERDPTSGPINC